MDIRRFFAPVGGAKKGADKGGQSQEAKRKNRISDSDDEEPLPPQAKRRAVLHDSDDDIFAEKEVKKDKKKDDKSKSKAAPKPSPAKLKPASAMDFFGSAPAKPTDDKKRKKSDESRKAQDSDEDFEKTLQQLDKKAKHDTASPDKPTTNENSPPNKTKGLAAKLSTKIKEERKDKEDTKKDRKDKEDTKKDRKNKEDGKKERDEHKKDRHHSHDKDKHKSDKNESKDKDRKEKDIKKEKVTPEKQEKEEKTHSKEKKDKITPKKEKEEKHTPKKPKEEKITPKKEKEEKITPKKEKITPDKKKEGEEDDEGGEGTPQEKKKNARAAYFKFLSRSGPANPGSKPIPEGQPECLQGLVFVLTGVYESLDREEASELVKRYGGKVTSSISRNTSYVVVGSEAGESKLKKAESLGTKQLDEDGLLELIRTRPGKAPKDGGGSGSAGNKLKAFERDAGKAAKHSTPASPKATPASPKTNTPSPMSSLSQKMSQANSSPSSTSSSPKTQPLSSQELSGSSGETLMWVDKYKPQGLKNIIGQQGDKSNVRKLLNWVQNWHKNQCGDKKPQRPSPWAKDDNGAFFKCALLSGPPGVGKTTTAHLVCKEAGFDFVELNASDARSKRTLDETVAQLLNNKSLASFATGGSGGGTSARHALVMDEVDGMSGNEDRGGVQELIALIKKSRVPIIAMCNDRNHPKIRSLANHCFDLRFHKPRLEQIRGPMMSICFREGIKIKPDALDEIIHGSNQDIRQILHHLSLWSATEKNLQHEDMKKEASRAKKDMKMGPWDVCKKVFSESDRKNMSIHDKSGLFFHDYSIASLFVQENYPKAVPHEAKGNRRKVLEQLAKAASSLADGDLVEKAIRSNNAWSLLPTQAMFSSVAPGDYMCGHLAGQIEFPRWLGNNSKKNKMDRLMQELQMHMRLKISGSKLNVGMEYCAPLRNAITAPMAQRGAEGVAESVGVMTSYDLLREDLDALQELSAWPGTRDPMEKVESKVKAAFTRLYNKESAPSPYTVVTVKKKAAKSSEDMYGEEEEEEEEEDNDDISADAMIKVKKGGAKGGESSKGGKGRGSSSSSSGRGRGGGRGRGKAK